MKLEGLEPVRGQKFADEEVAVDGKDFVDCHFDRCTLTYSGGEIFCFTNSPLNNCDIVFLGAANNTILALAAMFSTGLDPVVENVIASIRNPLQDTVQ